MSLNLVAGGFLTWQDGLDPHRGMAAQREAKASVAFINSHSSAGEKSKREIRAQQVFGSCFPSQPR